MASHYSAISNTTNGGNLLGCCCTPDTPGSNLQLGSHEYPALVQEISRYASPRSPIQPGRQENAYRELRVSPWNDIDRSASTAQSDRSLQKYARLIDDLFFFGALHEKGRCVVEWCPGLLRNRGFYGLTGQLSDCVYHRQIHKVNILIDPDPGMNVNGSCSSRILGVLLHEFCHAVLMLYGCKQNVDAETHLKFMGLSGHGLSFCDLFGEILRATKDYVGISFDGDPAVHECRDKEDETMRYALSQVGASPDIRMADSRTLERAILYSSAPICWRGFWTVQVLSESEVDEIERRRAGAQGYRSTLSLE